MAAKKTSDLIPMCHPLAIARVEVRVEPPPRATAHETVEVGVQPEIGTVPDRNNIVGSVRPQETPIGHGDGGVGDRHVFATHKRNTIGVIQRSAHGFRSESASGQIMRCRNPATGVNDILPKKREKCLGLVIRAA